MYSRKHNVYVPEFLAERIAEDNFKIVNCPICYVNHVETRLKETETELIKLYSQASPDFVQYDKIVNRFLIGRWKSENSTWGFNPNDPKPNASLIMKSLDAVYDMLSEYKADKPKVKKIKLPKGTKKTRKVKAKYTCKITLNEGITIEKLREDYEKYEYRKFLRKL